MHRIPREVEVDQVLYIYALCARCDQESVLRGWPMHGWLCQGCLLRQRPGVPSFIRTNIEHGFFVAAMQLHALVVKEQEQDDLAHLAGLGVLPLERPVVERLEAWLQRDLGYSAWPDRFRWQEEAS